MAAGVGGWQVVKAVGAVILRERSDRRISRTAMRSFASLRMTNGRPHGLPPYRHTAIPSAEVDLAVGSF